MDPGRTASRNGARGTKRGWAETVPAGQPGAQPDRKTADAYTPHPLDGPVLGAVPAHAAAQRLLEQNARGALTMDFP